MGAFAKQDIVLYPFPFTDLSARKLRPCLVLSSMMGQDILLCQMTSRRLSADTYSVEVAKHDTQDGTLHIDSYVRANMLFTAESSQIVRKICRLKTAKYSEIVRKIVKMIS